MIKALYSLLLLPLFVITVSCKQSPKTSGESEFAEVPQLELVTSPLKEESFSEFKKMGNTIGVVSMIDYPDNVALSNKDGSLWMEFDYKYEEKMKSLSYTVENIESLYPTWKEEFSPWAFKIDYMVLVFRCISQGEDSYTVIVNEDSGLEKILKKTVGFQYQAWSEHLFHCIINLYTTNNKGRIAPDSNSAIAFTDEAGAEGAYEAVEVKDDWVKLRGIEYEDRVGWIRWRDGDKLLVDIYYLM